MTEIYESALRIFNKEMATSYSVTNPELILITKKTGVLRKNAAIERLHASKHHAESPSDFNYMRAEALIGMDGEQSQGRPLSCTWKTFTAGKIRKLCSSTSWVMFLP